MIYLGTYMKIIFFDDEQQRYYDTSLRRTTFIVQFYIHLGLANNLSAPLLLFIMDYSLLTIHY